MSSFGDRYANRLVAEPGFTNGLQGNDEITIPGRIGSRFAAIYGNMGDDRLINLAKDNTASFAEFGGQGDDLLKSVHSRVIGGGGDDVFYALPDSNPGYTYMIGGTGDDTFFSNDPNAGLRVGSNQGDDVIYAAPGSGFLTTFDNFNIAQEGDDMKLAFDDGGSVLFKDWAVDGQNIPNVFLYDFDTDPGPYDPETGEEFFFNLNFPAGYFSNANDLIVGTNSDNFINTRNGNDTIYPGGGNDYVFAGAGDDILSGQEGNNFLDGGVGNDDILLFGDTDIVIGGNGDDIIRRQVLFGVPADTNMRLQFDLKNEGDDVVNGFNVTTDLLYFEEPCLPSAVDDGDDTVVTYPGGTITLTLCSCAATIDTTYRFGKAPRFRTQTLAPTSPITNFPTVSPSVSPTNNPTTSPTTSNPTISPTASPTSNPSTSPTKHPTTNPTVSPSFSPTLQPTNSTASEGNVVLYSAISGGVIGLILAVGLLIYFVKFYGSKGTSKSILSAKTDTKSDEVTTSV